MNFKSIRSLVFAAGFFAATSSFAETATFDVTGMHCGACKKEIQEKVCKMEGVTSCKVELTNKKKQQGQVTMTTAEGVAIDATKVQELLTEAGDYKLIKSMKK